MGEFLWWAVIIDNLHHAAGGDYVRRRDRDVPWLRGLRHARNVVAHGSNPAGVISTSEGYRYPRTYPRVFREVVWRPFDELPQLRDDPKAPVEQAYRAVEGRPIRLTVSAVVDWFAEQPHGG